MVDFTAEEFSTLMATNFESVFHISQLAYQPLKASGVGSVVFMSSVSGFVSLKSMSVQSATKGNMKIFLQVAIKFELEELIKNTLLYVIPRSY